MALKMANTPVLAPFFAATAEREKDPLTVKAPIADPLPAAELKKFQLVAKPLVASLEQTSSEMLVADAR